MNSAIATPSRLQCRAIGVRFGGAQALTNVDFDLAPGEVHGLIGANGAGKSTLMKVLAGVLPQHEGQVLFDGQPVTLDSPQAALAHGIAMVYQELSGVGQLSVAENLFLGRQPLARFGRIDWAQMRRRAAQRLGELGIEIDVARRLDRYPLVVRQMVEIARGLDSGARVLILDEPTSALSPPETRRLFELISRLRAQGVSLIFISHFLEDVLEICDRVTVLKDGRHVLTAPAAALDKHACVEAMLGRSLAARERAYETTVRLPPRSQFTPKLRAQKLALTSALEALDLEVAPGECLGLYGFVGAGHQELAHALAGALRPSAGRVLLGEQPLPPGNVHRAVERGVVLVAADRAQTLFHTAPVFKNATLAHLRRTLGEWLSPRREVAAVAPLLNRVGCRPAEPRLRTGALSGGNQQKVVFARWLLGPVEVLVLDEPTRGMDVGAKEEIMALVADMKRKGVAVVLSSSEPELLLDHADRILVFRRGRVTCELVDALVDKARLMREA